MRSALSTLQDGARAIGRPRLAFLSSLTVGHTVVHWYTQLLSLSLPFLKADLHLTDIQVGTITTTQMGVNSATTLPSGYVADSYPQQGALILAAAIVAFGVGLFLLGNARSYAWVLPGVGLIGLGTALWHPGAMGSLSVRFPDRRGFALSVHGVGASIGDSLAPVIVGAIILTVSWRIALQVHLIPALIFALVLWRGLGGMYHQPGPRPPFRSYVSGIRGLLTNRQVLAVMLSNALMGMARLSILTFLPIYIKETLGYSSFLLGVYLTLLYVMGLVSQPVMGVLSDRVGRKAVIVPSFAAMGLLFLAIGFAHGGIQLGLVIGALGMFFYAILNITQTAVMDVAGEGVQASTMGVMGLFSQPFTLGSPVLAGYLASEFGIKTTFWYAAAAGLLAAAVLVPVRFGRAPGSGAGH
ncbi:MAG: MFS transporter [Chloroflexi bacterium]|nr:MFS transporter [Chloroflexota bacterium]